MRFRVGVVGVTGYSGLEVMRLALRHPAIDCVAVMASETTGEKPLDSIHPRLRNLSDLVCLPQDPDLLESMGVDTAFLCTPNEVSYELVPKLLSRGMRVIDLSGSFRLKDVNGYPLWYGFSHQSQELLDMAVYGLSEYNSDAIAGADLVANPGCYPTSVLLAMLPLVQSGMLEPGSDIVCDSKSGVTGAGRGLKQDMLFGEISENFRAYNPIKHRHAPEICQELGWDIGDFIFVPHLLPVNRGILSTIYVKLRRPTSSEELEDEFRRRYGSCRFIRILGASQLPELRAVSHTNFCDIGWRLASGGRRAVVFSAIDNLVKGAAGQAVQNFNLMHGLEEGIALLERESGAIHG